MFLYFTWYFANECMMRINVEQNEGKARDGNGKEGEVFTQLFSVVVVAAATAAAIVSLSR